MSKLTLITGAKTYEIEDENGKHLCDLAINTTDLNVMNKLLNMDKKVKEVIPELDNIDSDEEAIEILKSDMLKQADNNIRAIIDDAFGVPVCDQLFQEQNCLSINTAGVTLVERFLLMITPVISNDYKEAMEASDKRIKKYTSQVK